MKKFKCTSTPKVRTVTEIIHSNEKLKKDYDVAEFDAKNLNSLESYNDTKIKSILVKYMAMLNTLQLTQPLLTIFRDRSDQSNRDISEIVLSSLAFVHKRVNPMVNHFDKRINFSIVELKNAIIPGEPIIFKYNENEEIVCYIDRVSILKCLDKQFDTNMVITSCAQEYQKLKLVNTFTAPKKPKRDDNDYDIRLSEIEATQYLILLLIMEHTYMHYTVLKNYGMYSYTTSLVDHSLFSKKCRPSLNMNTNNLLMSKFKFTIEEGTSKSYNQGLLSYTEN
ncbi:ODV-EC27 [Rachiplusia nu nucleopolyhedrovirus]|uniref:ODV-EC27 n=1 Tax=Rachiplusia nu nucleopolyhedrovirus TaxID=2605775 RepID=A0AAF1DB24_9ABAC|nr:ODV-EC27 [Rachiplusia nu nucleopolyhedrovirus]QEI03582.1 ODV-EC27 [Rachiplusia nu nucleopolyhedrovirus]